LDCSWRRSSIKRSIWSRYLRIYAYRLSPIQLSKVLLWYQAQNERTPTPNHNQTNEVPIDPAGHWKRTRQLQFPSSLEQKQDQTKGAKQIVLVVHIVNVLALVNEETDPMNDLLQRSCPKTNPQNTFRTYIHVRTCRLLTPTLHLILLLRFVVSSLSRTLANPIHLSTECWKTRPPLEGPTCH